MKILIYFLLDLLLLIPIYLNCSRYSDKELRHVPTDLKIVAVSGGLAPMSDCNMLRIHQDVRAGFTKYIPQDITLPPLAEIEFKLSQSDLAYIWNSIKYNEFLAFNKKYIDESVADGYFLSLTITANGKTHHVIMQNTSQYQFDAIVDSINVRTPEDCDLTY